MHCIGRWTIGKKDWCRRKNEKECDADEDDRDVMGMGE